MFQQLENVQTMEDKLRDARSTSERLAHEKDRVSTALESEKVKVISLTQEKSITLEEKRVALQEIELALEAKRKSEEEKSKALEEWQRALQETERVNA